GRRGRTLRANDQTHEVFVAQADHNHDEIASDREIYEVEDAHDDIRSLDPAYLDHEIGELEDELEEQDREAHDQANQKRCDLPAAAERDRLDDVSDALHYALISRSTLRHSTARRAAFLARRGISEGHAR